MKREVTQAFVAALVAAAAASCGGVEAMPKLDAGQMPGTDAGDDTSPGDDAIGITDDGGVAIDSATGTDDATGDGAADAPVPPGDDSGATGTDSGVIDVDSGVMDTDSGVVASDSGADAAESGCVSPAVSCSGMCTNTQTDPSNCGGCGNECATGTMCAAGQCTPTCGTLATCTPAGSPAYCANLDADNANCGACGYACPSGTSCGGHTCNTTCGVGFVDCGGSCVDGRSDPNHCGATSDCSGSNAGVQCPSDKSCVAGSCVCAGKTSCNGSCVDTTNDPNNCGGCGNVCQGVCVNGGCATSCANLLALDPSRPSGSYLIDPDGIGAGPAYAAYCDMTDDGGGWTLALKATGAGSKFTYWSRLWTNTKTLNPASSDLSLTEAKFQSFWQIAATSVLLKMVDVRAAAPTNTQVVSLQEPATLLSLVSGPFTPTALGRSAWYALANDATIQPYCNMEGFNAYFSPPYARARIGLLGNQERDCNTPDSALGFGVESGPGNPCYETDPSYGVGVVGGGACWPSGPDQSLFGYVFVR